MAYLTDAGSAGLIVLDLETGDAVRVLNDALSTHEYMPVSAECVFPSPTPQDPTADTPHRGSILYNKGKPFYFYADQHEVSPDAEYYYFQPASGGMSRIPTKWMNAAFTNSSLNDNAILGQYVEPYSHTPNTGGTAIDAEGNIYNSDTDSQRIIKIAPNGTMSLLVQDPRLLWVVSGCFCRCC